MKPKKQTKSIKPKLPKGFRVDKNLSEKYSEQPLFKEKVDRANYILKTVDLPKL